MREGARGLRRARRGSEAVHGRLRTREPAKGRRRRAGRRGLGSATAPGGP